MKCLPIQQFLELHYRNSVGIIVLSYVCFKQFLPSFVISFKNNL